MKKWYRTAGVLLLGIHTLSQVQAQGTHYGQGAGTQGVGHAFFGVDAGKMNVGKENTYVGHEAGRDGTIGYQNTYVGFNAGKVTNSNYNTMIGARAGENSTGQINTFIGYTAGQNTKGHSNTFIGFGAGDGNIYGNWNTYMGLYAGHQGDDNTIVGYNAGPENTGNENAFFGKGTGFKVKLGSYNTFIGTHAGFNATSGTGNAFFGRKAGYETTIGNSNSFFGYQAGIFNTTGSNNTYLGYQSGGNATLTNATAIGANALVTASNSVVLGNSAKVGIGYSAPSFQLHLSTDAAAKAGSPDWIVASDSRLKKSISNFTDGLDLLKQIRPVWFQYNGQAGIETGDKKFVGIIAQEMQKIAPYTIGTFAYQDSLGNKTEYLDYDASAVTYILINSVKEQQRVIEQKDVELKEMNAQVTDLSKRLEQLERIVASNTAKPLNGSAARMEPNANGVVLEQNVPNGFSGSSAIKYFIPQSVKEARVDVYAVNGMKMNSYRVKERGEGQLTISAGDFQNGVFLYDLVTDGKSNGVKKMVVQK